MTLFRGTRKQASTSSSAGSRRLVAILDKNSVVEPRRRSTSAATQRRRSSGKSGPSAKLHPRSKSPPIEEANDDAVSAEEPQAEPSSPGEGWDDDVSFQSSRAFFLFRRSVQLHFFLQSVYDEWNGWGRRRLEMWTKSEELFATPRSKSIALRPKEQAALAQRLSEWGEQNESRLATKRAEKATAEEAALAALPSVHRRRPVLRPEEWRESAVRLAVPKPLKTHGDLARAADSDKISPVEWVSRLYPAPALRSPLSPSRPPAPTLSNSGLWSASRPQATPPPMSPPT